MKRFFLPLVLLTLVAATASAQDYPTKPIRLINPLGAGGTAEALSRTLAKGLQDGLGQPVVLETMSGAAGTIGVGYVSRAAPDGYTLLYGVTGANSIAPAVYRSLPYDPDKGLAPISIAFRGPNVVIVSTGLGTNSLQELIALAKSRPGTIHFASAGNGSMSHLNAERFKTIAGIDIQHVPYKGGGAASPDLLSGRVQMMIETGGSVLPLIRSGKLRPLAVTTPDRSPMLPDVPSVTELGMPELVSIVWGGVFAPGGTPRPILDKVAEAVARASRDPAYRDLVQTMNNEAVSSRPEQFQDFVRQERVRYGEVVNRLGIKLD
jgi:tripartite-type tricarboxylate transporter receptor subunit TctC